MLTRMEFKFSEEKCKKYRVTLNACYKTIEKLMAEYDIHQYGLGVYVAPIKKAFTPNVIKLRNGIFEGNTKNVLLFFL